MSTDDESRTLPFTADDFNLYYQSMERDPDDNRGIDPFLGHRAIEAGEVWVDNELEGEDLLYECYISLTMAEGPWIVYGEPTMAERFTAGDDAVQIAPESVAAAFAAIRALPLAEGEWSITWTSMDGDEEISDLVERFGDADQEGPE